MKRFLIVASLFAFSLTLATSTFAAEPAAEAPSHPQQEIADQLFKAGVRLEKTVHRNKTFSIYACLGKEHDDATLKLLASLPNVTEVDAGDSKITDEGAQWFLYMPQLTTLHLYDTQVGDATLAFLANHKSLQRLTLSNTNVTDAGLPSLRELRNLRDLRLNGTKVTDQGVAELARLPRLQILSLQNTEVSEGAVAQLQQAAYSYETFTPTYVVVRNRLTIYHGK